MIIVAFLIVCTSCVLYNYKIFFGGITVEDFDKRTSHLTRGYVHSKITKQWASMHQGSFPCANTIFSKVAHSTNQFGGVKSVSLHIHAWEG